MNRQSGWTRLFSLLSLAALLAFAACSDDDDPTTLPADDGPFDLTFTGTLAPHANQMLRVLVIRESGDVIVANETLTLPGDGVFSLTWNGILADGATYRIDFYADLSGDGSYDTPPEDHAWRIGLGQVGGDVTRDFQHDTNFTDLDDSFDFDLAFTATLAPHAGQVLKVAVVKVRSGSDETIVTGQATVAADGTVAFDWSDLLEDGHEYTIDFYADHNGNGICDGPPADHAWRIDLGMVRGEVSRDFQHDTNFTDVCSSFP